MYTLKQIAQRGTAWGGVAAFVVAAVAPLATPAFADSLNPLTDRSLTLSSSAPGWENYDGSGNPTYAQPNSGANGQKTGNTFDFKVSSAETIKGMTFQYCTTSAGECRAPGDNAVHGSDTASTSDLKVVTDGNQAEVDSGDFATVVNSTTGAVSAVPGFTDPNDSNNATGQYAAKDVAGNFVVYVKSGASSWTQSTDWDMTASNVENSTAVAPDDNTGQDNYITLTNTTGEALTAGQQVKVVFFGTTDNYIQNPGSGAFFVKINTYDSDATQDGTTLVDGGVTVANVMNHSIRIQTKVLETMQFSVGTVDPNTLDSENGVASTTASDYEKSQGIADGSAADTPHGVCDTIATGLSPADPVNVLSMGRDAAEDSLEVANAFATHSYWRLSSNSSAGATVYYSGVTLSNTVGDKISPIGPTSQTSKPGSEQFGLAMTLADNTAAADESAPYPGDSATQLFSTNYDSLATYEQGADNNAPGVHASTLTDVSGNASWHNPRLYPLVPESNYQDGRGTLVNGGTAKFAFDETSNSIPVALATQDTQVVDCVTARMRYVANIAATTPAGIYTTAVNYIAAPQY